MRIKNSFTAETYTIHLNARRSLRVYQLSDNLPVNHQPNFMKKLFSTKILVATAVAIAAAASVVVLAQEQPMPPPAADNSLPANIQPGSPLADVVKLLRAGVDESTIKNFIANTSGAFGLDADKIIFLKDEGLSSALINAMMDHDKSIAAAPAPQPEPAPTANVVTTDTAPPTAPITVNYFYDTLSPYGSWVNVDGYGRCWRPTAVNYDSGWRPYCDRGHWVYTDCGWYWDSDYSWGVTFHYGRWFHDTRFGWCWLPDTEWAPSWVAWRSCDDYCGWAPLPPFAVFRPGIGFFYRGAACGADFDFGLGADFFIFVAPKHFCDRHPRQFCADHDRGHQIFSRTTVINNYNIHNTTIVNGGFSPTRISGATHRPIEPIHVGSLPNAGRQGWRGENPPANRPGNFHEPVENHNPQHNPFGGNVESRPAMNDNNSDRHQRFENETSAHRPVENFGNSTTSPSFNHTDHGTPVISHPAANIVPSTPIHMETPSRPSQDSQMFGHDAPSHAQNYFSAPTHESNHQVDYTPHTSTPTVPEHSTSQPSDSRPSHNVETPSYSAPSQNANRWQSHETPSAPGTESRPSRSESESHSYSAPAPSSSSGSAHSSSSSSSSSNSSHGSEHGSDSGNNRQNH
jgi:hypothetical protein